MELRQRVSRVRFGETRQALGDLAAQRGSDAVHLAEKLVRPRIGRREVRGLAERLDGVLVLPSGVLRDPEADVEPRRLRMALDGGGEHLRGLFERAQLQQVVAPVEEVLLGGRHVRGALILRRPRATRLPARSSTSPSRLWSSAVSFAAIIRAICARASSSFPVSSSASARS